MLQPGKNCHFDYSSKDATKCHGEPNFLRLEIDELVPSRSFTGGASAYCTRKSAILNRRVCEESEYNLSSTGNDVHQEECA